MTAETPFNVLKSLDRSELKRFDKMYRDFYKACGMVETEPKKLITDEEATEYLIKKVTQKNMEVKIYREPENENLIIEGDALIEYHDLVKKLGLKNESKEHTPSVYVPINSAMEKLLKAICPNVETVESYNKSTIPLEVLKVLDFAKKNEMYEGYDVWHAQNDPDPLLVGWKYLNEEDRKKGYSWNRKMFLMARWGDCALEIDDLLKKGFDILKTSLIDSSKEVLSYAESVLRNPDSYVRKHLKSNINAPSIKIDSTSAMGDLPF